MVGFFSFLMYRVLVQRLGTVRTKVSEILVAFPNWKQTILLSEREEEDETRKKVQHLEQESKTCQKAPVGVCFCLTGHLKEFLFPSILEPKMIMWACNCTDVVSFLSIDHS